MGEEFDFVESEAFDAVGCLLICCCCFFVFLFFLGREVWCCFFEGQFVFFFGRAWA